MKFGVNFGDFHTVQKESHDVLLTWSTAWALRVVC